MSIPGNPLLLHNLRPALPQRVRVGRQRRLHAHLDGLERTQRDVGEELGRRRRAQVHDRLVHVGEEPLAVVVLEDLIQAVLAGALEGVADERGRPAEEDAAHALVGVDLAPALDVGLVDVWVDLSPGLDDVEGSDGGVGWAACCETVSWQIFRDIVEGN
jgi:hypothetical protein